MSLSLFLKKEKKNWKFSLFFSFLTNELMDMEAAAVFCKEFAGINRILFVFGKKKLCSSFYILYH